MFSASLVRINQKMVADFIRSVGKFLPDYLHGVSCTECVHIMVDSVTLRCKSVDANLSLRGADRRKLGGAEVKLARLVPRYATSDHVW